MSNITGRIREALTRKLGPLPAWAWLLAVGAAVFAWRSTRGQYAAAPVNAGGADGGGSDPIEPREPFSLGAGESVYDPNTGQLISTAPEQQPSNTPEPQFPTVLQPGQSVLTPDGRLVTAPVVKPPKKKRRPKPKPPHKKPKPKPPHPGHGKPKPRGGSKVKKPKPRPRHKPKPPPAKKRPPARPAAHAPVRSRAHVVPKPAVRQRIAATHPQPSHSAKAHPKATPPKKRR